MKHILFLFIFNILFSYSQSSLSTYVYQDGKLLFQGDTRGNKAGTLDLLYGAEYQFNQQNLGYMTTGVQGEYADLVGGVYQKYNAYLGYNFNTFLKYTEVGINIGYGGIKREGVWTGAFSSNLETSVTLIKNLQFTINTQYTQRTDLIRLWGTKDYHRFSFMGGFKYTLPLKQSKIKEGLIKF